MVNLFNVISLSDFARRHFYCFCHISTNVINVIYHTHFKSSSRACGKKYFYLLHPLPDVNIVSGDSAFDVNKYIY